MRVAPKWMVLALRQNAVLVTNCYQECFYCWTTNNFPLFLTLKILSVFCQEDTLSSYFRPSKDQPDLGQSACTLKSVLTETREWRSIHTWQNLLSLLLSILPWLIPIHLSSLLLQWPKSMPSVSYFFSVAEAFQMLLGSGWV